MIEIIFFLERGCNLRFNCLGGWEALSFEVWDFDSVSNNDFIGLAWLRLPAVTLQVLTTPVEFTLKLKKKNGSDLVKGKGGLVSTLNVEVTYLDYMDKLGSKFKC